MKSGVVSNSTIVFQTIAAVLLWFILFFKISLLLKRVDIEIKFQLNIEETNKQNKNKNKTKTKQKQNKTTKTK